MRCSFLPTTLLLALASCYRDEATAWSTTPSSSSSNPNQQSRRQALQQTVAAAVLLTGSTTAAFPFAAIAAADDNDTVSEAVGDSTTPRVTTRMGGLLEPYQDSPRSIRIMAPSGWNKFDGEVGAYDLKWQDVVDPMENIKISSSPVKSTTESVTALGAVQEVGQALAARRKAKLLSAAQRVTEGIAFYMFDFALNDNTHQLLLLCVSRGKLWSVDANAKERRWSKREEMYKNILGSFMPKLA